MNAMVREILGETMAETIAHEPIPPSGRSEGPAEPYAMPKTTPAAGQFRYTYTSGARPLEGYTIKRAIGRGGFGEVYYATSDAGKEVALKLITRNVEIERRGVVQCMNLKSPNLITIYDMKANDEGDSFVIMEYVAGPSLANVLAQHPDGLPMGEVRAWLKGLVDGVSYLHDHGIVHRDLKPANLFLEEGVVKIGDYGLSKAISQSQEPGNTDSIGTCHYMAPEISTGKYHKPIDIYALGVILFEMIAGRVPFNGESAQEVLMKHLTARPDLSGLPEPYRGIVARAMSKDPNHRPSSPFEMLPTGEAPQSPPVRFLGESKGVAPGIAFEDEPKRDEVHRIGAEESVFFIGPGTWPTRQPKPGGWRWNNRRVAAPAPAPRPVATPRPPRRVALPSPSPALPPPPSPLPSGRVRLAELATSMISATPLTALLTVPAAFLLADSLDLKQPQQLALLFGLALLGTWGVLAATKVGEGRPVSWAHRGLSVLGAGLILGIFALTLLTLLDPGLGRWIGPNGPNLFVYGAYFALAFAANSGWNLTARDRPARVRVLPILTAALSGLALGLVLPLPRAYGLPPTTFWPLPHGLAVVIMVPIVTQLVSPWNKTAAAYARALRRRVA